MDGKKESKSSFPLPVILLISTFIAGGVFKYYDAPLDSMRPSHSERIAESQFGEEVVLSRMWQDPFQAVDKHMKRFKKVDKITYLRPQLGSKDNPILVLPVLTNGGCYPEDSEKRLRSRYVLLSALHVAGYQSDNASHIGVFNLKEFKTQYPSDKSECTCVQFQKDLYVPYEWFVQDPFKDTAITLKNGEKGGEYNRILIIWLSDEYIAKDIVLQLKDLRKYLQGVLKGEDGKTIDFKVIGPSDSTFLEKIIQEATTKKRDDTHKENKTDNNIELYSPWSTAEPFFMSNEKFQDSIKKILKEMEGIKGSNDNHIKKLKNSGITLKRTIHTDLCLTDELVKELDRRGVELDASGSDHVVLISEWDSFYGRALPLSFEISVEKYRKDSLEKETRKPIGIHKVAYMRGIDGMLPGDDTDPNSSVSKKQANASKKRDKSSAMGYIIRRSSNSRWVRRNLIIYDVLEKI